MYPSAGTIPISFQHGHGHGHRRRHRHRHRSQITQCSQVRSGQVVYLINNSALGLTFSSKLTPSVSFPLTYISLIRLRGRERERERNPVEPIPINPTSFLFKLTWPFSNRIHNHHTPILIHSYILFASSPTHPKIQHIQSLTFIPSCSTTAVLG